MEQQLLIKLAHCSVRVSDVRVYLEKYQCIDVAHNQMCGSRRDLALALLCDVCNKGFYTFCLERPLKEEPVIS